MDYVFEEKRFYEDSDGNIWYVPQVIGDLAIHAYECSFYASNPHVAFIWKWKESRNLEIRNDGESQYCVMDNETMLYAKNRYKDFPIVFQ